MFNAENFGGNDRSGARTPYDDFMNTFMQEMVRDFPIFLQQYAQNRGNDVSNFLPSCSIEDNHGGGYNQGGNDRWCEPPTNQPQEPPQNQPPNDAPPNQPPNDGGGNEPDTGSGDSRTPYNRKELGGQLLLDNFEQVDTDGDGFLRKREVQNYARRNLQGLERSSVGKVLDGFDNVKTQWNDQLGREAGLSKNDLNIYVAKQQQAGRINGYPGPETTNV